jgi:hypothetical protein
MVMENSLLCVLISDLVLDYFCSSRGCNITVCVCARTCGMRFSLQT